MVFKLVFTVAIYYFMIFLISFSLLFYLFMLIGPDYLHYESIRGSQPGKEQQITLGHSSELLALWMCIWAGQFKPCLRTVWSGPSSTLPRLTAVQNWWHSLCFLSFNIDHNSLAATCLSLAKWGEVLAHITQQWEIKAQLVTRQFSKIVVPFYTTFQDTVSDNSNILSLLIY